MKKFLSITLLFLFFIFIGSFLFYWYQIRPAQIKHECSWMKQHSDAIPARLAMTKEELIAKRVIRSCNAEIEALRKQIPSATYELGNNNVHTTYLRSIDGKFRPMSEDVLWKATSCIEDGNKVIADYKSPRKAIPAKNWYEAASKEEYTFCLHDHGL
jgi:hypothetical protein